MPSRTGFPDHFLWGVATSAYQIEGSPLADGASPSIWHRFSHTPGATHGGDTGDVACDHYRRYREDVALMRDLGIPAYRFSLSWGRLLRDGRGPANPPGLDFYSRLIDLLLAAGIRPMVTLCHWDLPAALDDLGGWRHRDSIDWFADYAELAFRAYGDRVDLWATFNEPWMMSDAGYLKGLHAPGHRDPGEAVRAAHHLLCAHGAAVERFRAGPGGAIGLVVNLEPKHPATDAAADAAAAARAGAYMNRHYLDPLFLGHYPEELPAMFGDAWPRWEIEDFARIRQPIDFLGVNYYSRGIVRDDPASPPARARSILPEHAPRTAMGWEIHPDGLREILEWVKARYGDLPLYVTENGAAFDDPPAGLGGPIEDAPRVEYLRDHLSATRTALANGVDVRGYFAWSLLDNFEWQYGYAKRFGLVHVDFTTQRRTPKRSALFYRDVIRSHGGAIGPNPAAGTVSGSGPHSRGACAP
ncbi:MAG: beta-glucosidase [Candidatus Eisenbacteria bacterium]|uniref:Beta-glucosidase n=1 Tax=Eiseniibacteriota bacterium TaxID=2212470 RepID=A0A538UDJ3_UNCEI|nr:MAG: beta-glucosidase [Candidatus Eisenbacteria bacterium]